MKHEVRSSAGGHWARAPRWARAAIGLVVLGAAACTGTIEGAGRPRSPGDKDDPAAAAGGAGGGGDKPPGAGGAGGTGSAQPDGCGLTPRRLWKLTPEQYSRTVAALLPGVTRAGDAIAGSLTVNTEGFTNEAATNALTGPHVTQVLQSAFTLASAAAADPAKLLPCLGQAAPTRACLGELVGSYGAKAFRRELAPDEAQRLVDFVAKEASASNPREALKQFFLYLFASPHFLFRTELGPETDAAPTGPLPLTSFERASALSYFLSDGPPDAELFAAARAGALGDKAQIAAHTRRLLSREGGAPGLLRFFRESFRTDLPTGLQKDPQAFPAWTPTLAADLAREAEAFVGQVLWREGGKLSTLLTAEFSMLNAPLAAFYGVTAAPGPGFQKTALPPEQRAGLLTQAGVLAAQAISDESNPVRRGLYVREVLLCQSVPDPPADLNVVLPKQDGKRQWRERLSVHSADPRCAGCHQHMDALGLAFERYDGIGRFRDRDLGRPIDTAGLLTDVAGGDVPFKDAPELARVLARTPEVQPCLVKHALRYAQGRPLEGQSQDRCALERLTRAFADSGGDLIELAVAITTDDSFLFRR